MFRRRTLPFLVAALAVLLASRRAALADPKDSGNISFAASTDPERVSPGGKGVLVITGAIRKGLHVYADQRFKVIPEATTGVAYGKHEISKATSWKDPAFPEDPPSDVFFDQVVVKIPFEVASDAALPIAVGATIKWSACDEDQCYAPESKGPLTVEVKAPEASTPPPSPDGEGAPLPVAPAGVAPSPADPAPGEPNPAGPAPVASAPPPAPETGRGPFDVNVTHVADETRVTVRATEKEVVVLFEPAAGHHLYAVGHEGAEHPITVKGGPSTGVVWFEVVAPVLESTEVRGPYEVRLPYADHGDGTSALDVFVSWQACLDAGQCRAPEKPHRFTIDRDGDAVTIVAAATEVAAAVPEPTSTATLPAPVPPGTAAVPATAPSASTPETGPSSAPSSTPVPVPVTGPGSAGGKAVPATGLLFPVLGEAPKDENRFGDWWALLSAFVTGLALSLTPCVLPIIPITVSIIGGGRADLTRGRLTFLLSCYVLGLSLAFGVMGVAAALTGGSLAAAFQSPVAIWIIAGVFVLLSLGMFGIYELQPPAFVQRMQGGAKGGNPIGAFLFGALAAVIASPCTGPFIAAALVFIAQSGSVLLGFLIFFAIGLGMGSVFFAAGSLNLLMKPGPWMVWVRYMFGVIMIGGALYYLASADKLVPPALFVAGFLIAVAVAFGVARHLVRKEGEAVPHAASQAAKVAVLIAVATGLVAVLTRRSSADDQLDWTTVTSREQLVAEVDKARAQGKGTVVDVWATWCHFCVKYDDLIAEDPPLRDEMSRFHRLRMDLTNEDRPWEAGLREGLGIPTNLQPFMVFLDSQGRIRRDSDVTWPKDADPTKDLLERARRVR
jgi:thiol:disulfide interchange protein DsbD